MQKIYNNKDSIIKTLCYADLFDYPLTGKQLHRFLISKHKTTLNSVISVARSLETEKNIFQSNGFYYLKNRKKIINKRIQKRAYSKRKMKIAERVGSWLKIIPTVKAVAVTGALAMDNTVKDDDIDFMVITNKNRLWLTRLMVLGLVSLIAKRRTPTAHHQQAKTYKDHICINLFLDESVLRVPKTKRNLYTAHEVAQARFLWSKNKIKERFLFKNAWISEYLSNINVSKKPLYKRSNQKNSLLTVFYFILILSKNLLFSILENIVFKAQLFYMKPKMTTEQVNLHYAFFHPRNTSKIILNKYQERIRNLK